MKLLVGLGNPGAEYQGNRHNIGFMAVEEIARRFGFGPFRRKFQGRVSDGSIDGRRVLLLRPETYMNRSGRSVAEAARFHKIAPEDIVVFHDDLDLAPLKVKIKRGGGHGGHNGLRDLDAHLGPEYWRVRLGIGHPGDKARVHGYVLSDFAKAERPDLARLLEAVAETTPLVVEGRPSDMMTRLSALLRPAPPEPKRPELRPRSAAAVAASGPAEAAPPGEAPAAASFPATAAPGPETGLARALKNALLRRSGKTHEG